MSQKICKQCGFAFETGDLVRMVALTRYVALPSKVTYALSKPTDVEQISHANCQCPKGEPDGD